MNMGLPGRRTRERITSEKRNITCPDCKTETEVKVQKRSNIKRIKGETKTEMIDEEFDKDPNDAFTRKNTNNCENCGNSLTLITNYSPR